MTTQRDIALDVLRILACAMVVLMHAPMKSAHVCGPFLTALSYITAPSIGIFFMVSGALLLPVECDYATFLRRRFCKIAVPTLFWSLFYVALNVCLKGGSTNILRTAASIPFSAQGSGVLWFMYTLAGLYLLAPVISPWVAQASKREMQIVLGLWAVTLCYPLLENFITISRGDTGILYYFTGYAGYFLLGCYMRRWPDSLTLRHTLPLAVAGAVLLAGLKLGGIRFDFYRMFWYQSIFVAAFAAAIWRLVCKLLKYNKLQNIRGGVFRLADLSFGIYLVHMFIMRSWLWQVAWIQNIRSYVLQTLTIAVLTFALSVLLCAVMARLPAVCRTIGCRRK